MPSELSPPGHASPTRNGSSEQDQRPLTTGGVRGLLGLPMRASGVRSAAPLTAPPRGYHYGQPPLPVSEQNDESFREGAPAAGWIEEGGSPDADPQSESSGALRRDGVSLPRAIPGNPAEMRSTSSAMSGEHRQHTSFVIPGVSTHRTAFAAVSHPADTMQVTPQEESPEPGLGKAAPLHAAVSLLHTPEAAMFESELLSQRAHLVTEGAKAQDRPETPRTSVVTRSPSPVEQMGVPNGEQGDADVARRLTYLQRTVNELAATVAAQAAHMRDERQAQGRERQTPPQRLIVSQRGDTSSTTPRAFWERSRLGRVHLRTGR
jgi:hypothetical protein